MDPEPLTPTSPRPVRTTVFRQAWLDLTFVHWALDPSVVAPLLPDGVRPDVLGGATQVGLVAFRMRDVGIGRSPAVPYFGSFAETNVRLYTVDEAGRRGVFFLSLDASRLVPVLVARALGVPYRWSRMSVAGTGPDREYACRRRWPGPRGATSRLVIRPGARIAEPSELERFVTARWGLHLSGRTGPAYWPNEHPEWPLHRAELVRLDDELVAAAGLPRPDGPPTSVLWSPGVRVRFGPKRPVRAALRPGPGAAPAPG
jgi:uncharacterized protein YqjF (DUF2071 family)